MLSRITKLEIRKALGTHLVVQPHENQTKIGAATRNGVKSVKPSGKFGRSWISNHRDVKRANRIIRTNQKKLDYSAERTISISIAYESIP